MKCAALTIYSLSWSYCVERFVGFTKFGDVRSVFRVLALLSLRLLHVHAARLTSKKRSYILITNHDIEC